MIDPVLGRIPDTRQEFALSYVLRVLDLAIFAAEYGMDDEQRAQLLNPLVRSAMHDLDMGY